MDDNKIIKPEEVQPVVRYANYQRTENSWPHHDIPDLELVYIVNGCYSAADEDHPRELVQPGQVLLIRANKPCSLLLQKGPACISCLHFDLLPGLSYKKGDYRISTGEEPWIIDTGKNNIILELFRKCAYEIKNYSIYKEALLSTMVREIWIRLHGCLANSNRASCRQARVGEMVKYLRENLANPVTRTELAGRYGLTPEYVNQLFKAELGISPGELLNRERIRQATDLMRTGRYRVNEVADLVGFADPLYFSRVFKRIMGASPSSFL